MGARSKSEKKRTQSESTKGAFRLSGDHVPAGPSNGSKVPLGARYLKFPTDPTQAGFSQYQYRSCHICDQSLYSEPTGVCSSWGGDSAMEQDEPSGGPPPLPWTEGGAQSSEEPTPPAPDSGARTGSPRLYVMTAVAVVAVAAMALIGYSSWETNREGAVFEATSCVTVHGEVLDPPFDLAELDDPTSFVSEPGCFLLVADFEDGPEPFQNGVTESFRLETIDGRYRFDIIETGSPKFSFAPLLEPTYAIEVDAVFTHIGGEGERFVGIGCETVYQLGEFLVPVNYGYQFRLWSDGAVDLIWEHSDLSDEPTVIAQGTAEGFSDYAELQSLTIRCVRAIRSTELIGFVNGAAVIDGQMEDSQEPLPFTHIDITGSGGDDAWLFELEETIAYVP